MITWDDGDTLRRSEGRKPGKRSDLPARQTDVDEVSGDGSVIRGVGAQIDYDAIEPAGYMGRLALVLAIAIAERALHAPIRWGRPFDRAEMNVGQMCDGKDGGHARMRWVSPDIERRLSTFV